MARKKRSVKKRVAIKRGVREKEIVPPSWEMEEQRRRKKAQQERENETVSILRSIAAKGPERINVETEQEKRERERKKRGRR